MGTREKIPRRIIELIRWSQKDKCLLCDFPLVFRCHKHHIIPHSKSGPDHYYNLIGLCPNHHGMIEELKRSETTLPSNITSLLHIADVNNDNLLDVVSIDDVDLIGIYKQETNNNLNAAVTLSITHNGYDDIDVGDMNNDNLNDIIVMSGQGYLSPNFGILFQNSNGYDPPTYYNVEEDLLTNSLAIGDVNNDGRKDVAVSFTSSIGIFFQNQLKKYIMISIYFVQEILLNHISKNLV